MTNMRIIEISALLRPLSVVYQEWRYDGGFFFGGGREGWLDSLFNTAFLAPSSHTALSPFFFPKVAHSSTHTYCQCRRIHRMTKMTKELAQTGVQAEGGMSTLSCPGGGRNPIKLRSLKFRLGYLLFDWQRWLDVCFVSSTKKSGIFFCLKQLVTSRYIYLH